MSEFKNIYEQIDSNKRKSIFLIIGFILFFVVFGYFFSAYYSNDPSFLIFALLFSSITSIVSFYNSDKIALTFSGAVPADPRVHSTYLSILENISRVADIPTPSAHIIPSRALNAFATGRDPDHAAVAVTQGLLDSLDRTELEGVIAHEIAHIKNFDTRLMTLVSILVGSIAIIIDWSFRWGIGRRSDDNRSSNPALLIIGLLLIILAPLIANLIKFAISRRREFFADAQGVKFTRQPSGLIRALEKISSSSVNLDKATPATAHMYISNPFKGKSASQWIHKIFSTHPPVEDRIRALEGNI